MIVGDDNSDGWFHSLLSFKCYVGPEVRVYHLGYPVKIYPEFNIPKSSSNVINQKLRFGYVKKTAIGQSFLQQLDEGYNICCRWFSWHHPEKLIPFVRHKGRPGCDWPDAVCLKYC